MKDVLLILSWKNLLLPIQYKIPSIYPSAPFPWYILKWSAGLKWMIPSNLALFMIARAIGWSVWISKDVAIFNIVILSNSCMGRISCTTASPVVSVPVLSNANTLILAAFSRNIPPLIRIPSWAAAVNPATMLTGVDITKEHGHDITRSSKPLYNQGYHELPVARGGTIHTTADTSIINGT